MKKFIYSITAAASFFLSGCGGGGGSSSSITGTVQASFLEGVKVCVKDSDICSVTDKNGKFSLGVSAPAELEVKIGNSVVGYVNANASNVNITPATLTDYNETAAAYLGTVLHVAAGCPLSAENCNLSDLDSIDIDPNKNMPLVEELMESGKNVPVSIVKDGLRKEINVTELNATLYMSSNPLMIGKKVLSYHGIVSAKGYLNFNIDPETMQMTYEIKDFNNNIVSKGSEKLLNLYENVFFRFENGYSGGMFISRSLAVGYSMDSEGEITYQIGLQYPYTDITASEVPLFANRTYNSIKFNADKSVDFSIMEINNTNPADLNGTWSLKEADATFGGIWRVEGDHIGFYSNSNLVAVGYFKPGEKRTSLVYLSTDGSFGIGLETKALSADELKGVFYYENLFSTSTGIGYCFGRVNVNGTSFSYQDDICSDNQSRSGSGTLVLNPSVDINGNSVILNGAAKLSGSNEYVFIDSDEGYYIAINPITGEVSLGSNRPIK